MFERNVRFLGPKRDTTVAKGPSPGAVQHSSPKGPKSTSTMSGGAAAKAQDDERVAEIWDRERQGDRQVDHDDRVSQKGRASHDDRIGQEDRAS